MDSGSAFDVHAYACAWGNTVAPYLSRSRHESRLQLLVTVVRVLLVKLIRLSLDSLTYRISWEDFSYQVRLCLARLTVSFTMFASEF